MNTAWRRLGLGAAGVCLAATTTWPVTTAAASSPSRPWLVSTTSASGSATGGGIRVTGAFLPLPASPSVAAAYLEIHNLTAKADTMISVSTSVASDSMAMSEGATSMQMLGPVVIPAHGTVDFTPGHDHLMLQGMHEKLQVGQRVDVRLRFRHAGTLSVEIPVVPLDRILGGNLGPTGSGGRATKPAPGHGTSPTTMARMAGM